MLRLYTLLQGLFIGLAVKFKMSNLITSATGEYMLSSISKIVVSENHQAGTGPFMCRSMSRGQL